MPYFHLKTPAEVAGEAIGSVLRPLAFMAAGAMLIVALMDPAGVVTMFN